MKLNIIKRRNLFFIFSATLVVISLLSWIAWGLKPGIDFTGGSLMEVQFKERPSNDKISESLKSFDLGDFNVQPTGSNSVIIRFKNIDEATHHEIITKLEKDFQTNKQEDAGKEEIKSTEKTPETETKDKPSAGNVVATDENGNIIKGISVSGVNDNGEASSISESAPKENISGDVVELRFDSIGASAGQDLRVKLYKAFFYVVIAIILYVAWAFRKVSKPVSSWKYGVLAVVALIHDIVITIGVSVFLGRFFGAEVNMSFVAARLTILGYSVNDTIVAFDRIRENLHRHYNGNFDEVVNDSINQTVVRSLNTSLTTIAALLAVYFFGGASIKDFALALIIGIAFGTYSSIFIASPLLVTWHKISEKLG